MNKTIAVLGAGAIGSSIGADFTKAGCDVALIDQWPAHVEAMKTRGLRVSMPEEELHISVQAYHLCELSSLRRQFDLVFLAAKSYDTCWMVELIKPYLKSDGVLVSIQNSLKDEQIAPIIGAERDIASVVELSGEVFEPGLVSRNTDHDHTWFNLGELHGRITPRLHEIAEILRAAGKVEVTTNIWGAKWSKLILNCMSAGLGGILGIKGGEIVKNPELLEVCLKFGREALLVARTLGYHLEPLAGLSEEDMKGEPDEILRKSVLTLFSIIDKKGKKSRSMVLQDHLKGRRTEVDELNGLIVRKGREANVRAPWNAALTFVTRQIEQGALKPGLSNLTLLEQYGKQTCSTP
jgi:2-dehydropantoate 2-reductase